MSAIVKVYTEEVRKHLRPLYPNWEPGNPVSLGDYGLYTRGAFIRQGSIKDFGLSFSVNKSTQPLHHKFNSSEGVTYSLSSGVNSISTGVNASLDIKFSRGNSIFFNAAGCLHHTIKDIGKLGNDILDLYQKKIWQDEFVVVTEVVLAGSTIIAISTNNDSNLVLQANNPNLTAFSLTDASIDLGVVKSSNIGYSVEGDKGLTILLGLSEVKKRLLSPPKFRPRSGGKFFSLQTARPVNTNSSIITDDLIFGPLDREPFE